MRKNKWIYAVSGLVLVIVVIFGIIALRQGGQTKTNSTQIEAKSNLDNKPAVRNVKAVEKPNGDVQVYEGKTNLADKEVKLYPAKVSKDDIDDGYQTLGVSRNEVKPTTIAKMIQIASSTSLDLKTVEQQLDE